MFDGGGCNMFAKLWIGFALSIVCLVLSPAWGQTPTPTPTPTPNPATVGDPGYARLTLTGGRMVLGEVLSSDGDNVRLSTAENTVTIPAISIVHREEIPADEFY